MRSAPSVQIPEPRQKGDVVKVRVDPERCQGHTLCAMKAPQMFELNDIDGHSSVVNEEVPPDQEARVIEAVRSCPERAIFISE
jgi:ferredoxin